MTDYGSHAIANIDPYRESDGRLPAYAWPGGYDIAYYVEDDAMICASCANGDNGSAAEIGSDDPQWSIVAWDVTNAWDEPETCEHCGAVVGPADD